MGQYASLFGEDKPDAALAVGFAADTSPDAAAQANAIARRYNLPPQVAQTFAEDYKARASTEDARAVFDKAPRLASWIAAQPERAKVTQDDLGALGNIESTIGQMSAYVMGATPDGGLPGDATKLARSLAAGFGPGFGAAVYGAAAYPFEAIGADSIGSVLRQQQRNASAVAARVEGLDPNAGLVERGIRSGVRSAGQTLATLPLGFARATYATGEQMLLGAMGGLTFGQTYGTARDKGLNVGQAGLYALQDATAEVVTEKFLGAAKLIGDAKAGMNTARLFMRDIAREVPGEMGATLWQNFNEWANVNPDKTVHEWLAEQPEALAETVIATIAGGGAQVGAIRAAQKIMGDVALRQSQAQQAEANAAHLETLTQLAAASKTMARDAVTAREFVAQIADEQGEAPTELYVDGAVLANTLNQSGMTIDELRAVAPVAAGQIEDAQTGTDIRLPVSEFMGLGDRAAALIDHIRVGEDQPTRAEARQFIETQGEQLAAQVDAELAKREGQAAFREGIAAVQAQLQSELDAAQHFRPQVNAAYATLLANFFGATAARLGIAPQELVQRYQLKVRSERSATPSARTLGQDATRANDGAAVTAPTAVTGESAARSGEDIAGQMYQPGQSQAPRAQISFPEDITAAPSVVRLLEGANLSSFIHEAGHFFLEVQADLAVKIQLAIDAGETVSAQERGIVEDMNALLKWFGVAGNEHASALDTWAMMSLDEKRAHHEKFAEGFETFAFEGKAPSIELQSLFQQFRAWMIRVYQVLRNMRVQLDDDVRAVMGRMLASDAAIEEAEAQRSLGPLFRSAEAAGMTLDEFNAYQLLGRGATEEAIDALQARGLSDMRWLGRARGKALKARQAEVEGLRRDMRQEARRDIYSRPVYRAWQFLAGRGDKQDTAEGEKTTARGLDVTRDSLLTAIAKLGGISRESARRDLSVTDEDFKVPSGVFGKPVFRAKGGRSVNDMREALTEHGYLLDFDEFGRTEIRELEERVSAELGGAPQYAAAHDYSVSMGLQSAQPLPTNALFGKLDTKALREQYGTADDAVWRKLSARRMTSDKGIDPDVVAATFGFESSDQLVQDLAAAVPPGEAVEALTDQLMLERHGDISSPAALARAADEAVHNQARARFIASELRALQDAMTVRKRTDGRGTVDLLARAAKAYAEEAIARQRIRDLRAAKYSAAEARNAKLAEQAFAAAKLDEAAMHKRNQLINHAAAGAALQAQKDVQAALRYVRKFDKRIKGLDPEYQDQIETLLEAFSFRAESLKAIDKRAAFAAWYAEQEKTGQAPEGLERLLDTRKSYKDMTVEELRGLLDDIRQIEHLGRLKNRLLSAQDRREFDATADELAASIREHGGAARAVELEGPSKAGDWLAGFVAEHRKLSSYFRQMDGGNDAGPMFAALGRALNERSVWEDAQIEQAVQALRRINAPVLALRGGVSGVRSKLDIPGVGSLTRGARLSFALNMGNAENLQRLQSEFTPQQIQSVMATLTSVELQYVNDVWAYLETYWPQIAEKQKRLTGKAPAKVEAVPFEATAADGASVAMTGGYYPIKYDANRSDTAAKQDAAANAEAALRGAWGRATTRRGHTKARVDSMRGIMRKDLNVITQHVQQVVHDLAWHEWLIDANRLLNDKRVSAAVRDHYGPRALKSMRDNIDGIAAGDIAAATMADKAFLMLRNNVTRATMGGSLTTAFLQPFGLLQSMSRIGAGPVLRGTAQWAGDTARLENTMRRISEKSDFMRRRAKTFNREMHEIHAALDGKHAALRAIDGGLFWLTAKMQLVSDIPTWLGQYEKTLRAGELPDSEEGRAELEARAIAEADRAVRESQGSGMSADLAVVQRRHPLLTQFYSYFSVTANLVAEKTGTTNFKNPRAVAGWLGDMALLAVIPAILPALLMHALRGGDDDEPEDWAVNIAQWQAGYLLGMVIGLREASGPVGGFDYAGPPAFRIFADAYKAGRQTSQVVGAGWRGDDMAQEIDEPLVMAYARLLGDSFGIPVTQLIRSYRGWQAWDAGEPGTGAHSVLFGPPEKH